MRLLRIFLLHFQYLLSHPSRSFVFIYTYTFLSLLYLAFIRGVFLQNGGDLGGWTLSSVSSYYFLIIVAPALLMTHPEHPVLRDDIENGELSGRLLKPFSYYWQRFFHELPYRLFQGLIATIIFIVLSVLFNNYIEFRLSVLQVMLIVIMLPLAYMLSFTFKMILAITGLWTTDIRGARELVEILIIIFAGFIVPVNLLPGILENLAYFLPFAYMIYFPVVAVQGQLSVNALMSVISVQILWLSILYLLFRKVWKKGLMRFTDLGH